MAMSEVALYRKYRPRKFSEVLGQEHVTRVLEGALRQGNISHAYLFSGSRGTGKTSVARILAGEVGVSGNDLYEIDAASNRGIDDMRELRDAVNTLPFESPYKCYIIDECHMLTKEAFNALLKTLEEPPAHVIFILATTEIDKLPETVISRCETYTFKKPSQRILKELVLSVAKKEGYTLEHSSADLIALLGDGSFRDTQGILQKIISSSSDKKISVEEVEQVVGAPRGSLVNDVIAAIVEGDSAKGLKAIQSAADQAVDMKVFIKLLLHKVRVVLLLRFAKELEKSIKETVSEEDFAFLKVLAAKTDSCITSVTLSELLSAYDATARAYIPQLPLELALVKLTVKQRTGTGI
jgi:DNA polymerase-3 subunit gamma/tau